MICYNTDRATLDGKNPLMVDLTLTDWELGQAFL